MSEREFWAGCPDVEVDPGGYRLAAETVVDYAELGSTPEEIVEYFPGTPLDKVKSVLAYYYAHQPELTRSN